MNRLEPEEYPFIIEVSIDEHDTMELKYHKNMRELARGICLKATLHERDVTVADKVRIEQVDLGIKQTIRFARPYPQGAWLPSNERPVDRDLLAVMYDNKIRLGGIGD